jgi:pimeloyl-ACP methyl ester carboxylesterase
MQFAYQFPERTERLMLVSAGGLGREVTPLIKVIQAPGWETAMAALTRPGARQLVAAALRAGRGLAPTYTRDFAEVASIIDSWQDRGTRFAIRHLVNAVIDWRGQVISMADRAYLTEHMPIAAVWGEDDHVLPAKHLETVRRLAPGASTLLLPAAGHFPHKNHPAEFIAFVDTFMARPAPEYDKDEMVALLRRGPLIDVPVAEGGEAPVDPVKVG